MFKEAHTISYIQQASHEWIQGDEEEIAYTKLLKAQGWFLRTFNTNKEKLSKFPILRRPDFSKVFILHTHSSALSVGVIFGQFNEEGKEYVIVYASRSNKVENNYFSYEGECLTLVWAVIHFRPYLYGTKFILYTDH